jgi:hypothetical protein
VGHVFDVLGQGELVVLGEVAGQGDDDQCGAPVGGPQGVRPGGPGVGDVEDAVEGGDRRQAGGEVAWACGSSTSMSSATMAI